jgi:hypothetical protein
MVWCLDNLECHVIWTEEGFLKVEEGSSS